MHSTIVVTGERSEVNEEQLYDDDNDDDDAAAAGGGVGNNDNDDDHEDHNNDKDTQYLKWAVAADFKPLIGGSIKGFRVRTQRIIANNDKFI